MKNLGATGQFPEGKLTPEDEGELRFAILEKHGNVVLEFGTPIKWLGLPPKRARALADVLIAKANGIEGQRKDS
jgi:hypothetical protein